MEINKIIKKRRLELGLTLKDVAYALGIAESTVSRYESSDIQNMGIDKIESLAKVLECSPAYLMGWEESTSSRITGQPSFFELPVCTIDNATILENELIAALRTLKESSVEEYDSLCSTFARIPSLPKELREDIYEYAFISIRKYDKEKLKKNAKPENAVEPFDTIELLEATGGLLNAAHERTDIEVTDDMKKHDNDIMDDDDF